MGGAGVGGELQEWGALLPLPSQELVRPTTHAGSSPISCAIAAVVRGYPLLGAVVGEPALGLDPGDDLVHTGQVRVRGAGLPPAAGPKTPLSGVRRRGRLLDPAPPSHGHHPAMNSSTTKATIPTPAMVRPNLPRRRPGPLRATV